MYIVGFKDDHVFGKSGFRIHTLNVYFLLGYTLGLLRSVIRIYVGRLSCIVYLE